MSQPHKCPVCDGTGLVSRPPHIAGDVRTWMSTDTEPYPCRPCKGEGVLWGPPESAQDDTTVEWQRGDVTVRYAFEMAPPPMPPHEWVRMTDDELRRMHMSGDMTYTG